MVTLLLWFIYFLIGFTYSRIAIVMKRELIWSDPTVHSFLFTLFWLPFLCIWGICMVFKWLGKFIDAFIEMLT